MKRNLLLLIVALMPVLCSAQFQPTGSLTFFSEDGDKFYVILNGERQNDVAQTNIRVEDLPQPYYSTKIIFDDKSIVDITKNTMLANPDGVLMDATYRIKKDRNGKRVLRAYSVIPAQQDFIAPPGMYVRNYGAPVNTTVVSSGPGGTVQQTTTLTTNTADVNYHANVGGVNMNVTVTDPVVTTTTTTTHDHHDHHGHHHDDHYQDPPPPTNGGCNGWPMNNNDFNSALSAIDDASFDETKVNTAKSIADNNCLSTDQIVSICNKLSFESSKLDFAKYAYARCTDRNNYFKVNKVFSFDSSKSEMTDFTRSH